jgi:hypothetical protein
MATGTQTERTEHRGSASRLLRKVAIGDAISGFGDHKGGSLRRGNRVMLDMERILL